MVTINVKNCTYKTAVYGIQLTGDMATEAVNSLVTHIRGLTKGLDLGVVVLFLHEQTNNLETDNDDQRNDTQSEIWAVIGVLSVIIVIMLVILMIFGIYLHTR